MARKRLNLRFIVPTLCGVAVAGALAVVVVKNVKPRNPQVYIAAGETAFKAEDWSKAAQNMTVAVDLLPQDSKDPEINKQIVSLHLKLGQCYYELRNASGENFQQSVSEFTKAEELQPDSKDAWRGLLKVNEFLVDQMEAHAGVRNERLPAAINTAREAAQHLVTLEPDNIEAQATGPIMLIRTWLLNLSMSQTSGQSDNAQSADQLTPDQMAEHATVELSKMMLEHPEYDKIPFWIARAKVRQAQNAMKDNHPKLATPLFDEAANQFEQSIVAKPEVVGLYLSKAKILFFLTMPGGDPDPQHWQKYRKTIHESLDKAQSLADPKNVDEYQTVKQQWANELRSTDPAGAEAVFRDLIEKFPQQLIFRQLLAEFLEYQPNRLEDAVTVLNEIPKLEGPPVTNFAARNLWETQLSQCRLVRANIEIDELKTTQPGKERDDLRTDIQASIDAAQKLFAGTSQMLRVQGRFQLYDGKTKEAIQTLTQAADKNKAEHTGETDFRIDTILLNDEAEAYVRGGQLGKAIEILEKAAAESNVGNNLEFQANLADLMIRNQDYEGALPHINWIAARLPDDPRVKTLQIRQLGPAADWSKVKPLYDQLPEVTNYDLGRKYTIASTLNNQDEAIRIMILMHQKDPGDISIVGSLVPMLIHASRTEEAKKYLAETQALHPGDKTLAVFDSLTKNDSTKDIIDQELLAILAISDPFQREMKLAQFYQVQDNPDEEMNHLQAALKQQPDEKGVLQTIFIRHLDAKRFTDAEAMIPHMAALNLDQAHGMMFRCKLALAKQDIPNALIFGRQMTNDNKEFAGSYEMYGEALNAAGQWDAASQQFELAIQYQATNYDAWRNLILCSVEQEKYAEARGHIADACKRFPGDPTYRDMRVQFEIQHGDPTSVLQELNTDIQNHPDERRNYAMFADALLASMRQASHVGQAEVANQYLSQARDTFQKATARWPDDLRFAWGLSGFFMQTGDFTGAEDCLKKILARPRWKDQPAPLVMLAKVYLGANKPDQAYTVLKQALAADPHSVDAYLTLADCLIIQKKYDDAKVALLPAVSDFRIRVKYIDLLVALGQGAEAEADLADAIKASPNNVALIDLLLHVYDQEGEFDRGIRAATEDIQNDPRNIFAYLWRGKMESEGTAPDYDAAIKDLKFFRDAVFTSVEGRVSLAKALDGKHDRDGAIHELQIALQLDPQNREVRRILLQDYLSSTPVRSIDAEALLTQTIAMPQFQHDAQFECAYALMLAKKGEFDKAIATMKDAMDHSKDDLTYNYYDVLLATRQGKYLQQLLDESAKPAADPKTSWFVFNDRGSAKVDLGQKEDSVAEFTIAMDRAGTETSRGPAELVAATVSQKLGVDKALEMVAPRAQNSVSWKMIAIDLYIAKGDVAHGISLVESALTSESSLPPDDKYHLYQQAAGLYLNANPPLADKAAEISQKILKMRPDDIDALNNMACILVDMTTPPQPEQALVYSQRAYDISQKSGKLNSRIYDTHGWVLIQNKHLEDGISVLDQINNPDFPEAYYHQADGYLKKGLAEDAQHQLSKAVAMLKDKPDPILKDKLDALQKQIDDAAQGKAPGKSTP